MPTVGELLLLQKSVVSEITEFLGIGSPAEKRFSVANRSVHYLTKIIATKRAN
jgi:hypothetical protein